LERVPDQGGKNLMNGNSKLSATDQHIRDGIYPSAEQYTDGLLQVMGMLMKGQPIPTSIHGFDTWMLLLHAYESLKNRTQEVEERDELIDELEAKIAKLEGKTP